jgi:hypothetical protein
VVLGVVKQSQNFKVASENSARQVEKGMQEVDGVLQLYCPVKSLTQENVANVPQMTLGAILKAVGNFVTQTRGMSPGKILVRRVSPFIPGWVNIEPYDNNDSVRVFMLILRRVGAQWFNGKQMDLNEDENYECMEEGSLLCGNVWKAGEGHMEEVFFAGGEMSETEEKMEADGNDLAERKESMEENRSDTLEASKKRALEEGSQGEGSSKRARRENDRGEPKKREEANRLDTSNNQAAGYRESERIKSQEKNQEALNYKKDLSILSSRGKKKKKKVDTTKKSKELIEEEEIFFQPEELEEENPKLKQLLDTLAEEYTGRFSVKKGGKRLFEDVVDKVSAKAI